MFRSIITALIAVAAFARLSAQEVSFYFSDTLYRQPASVCWIDLKANAFHEISTLQFTLKWDKAHLTLLQSEMVGLTNMIINASDSTLTCVWISTNGTGQTLADSTVLFRMQFETGNNWPVITDLAFGPLPIPLSAYHFDGAQLVEVPAVTERQTVVIRECHTQIDIAVSDTLCLTKNLALEPVQCIQCNSIIWNDSLNSTVFIPVAAGHIMAVAAGAWQCFDTGTVYIAPLPTAEIMPEQLEICSGETGILLASISSDAGFSWSTGAMSTMLPVTESGLYTVLAKNNFGCTAADSAVVTVFQSPEVHLITENYHGFNIPCANIMTGTIIAQSGSSPVIFSWSNGSKDNQLEGLSTGIYTVTVTDDHGCVNIQSVNLTAPLPLTITTQVWQPTCKDSINGAIILDISGGIPDYLIMGAIADSLEHLGAGVYTILVSDANGCTNEQEVILGNDQPCDAAGFYFPNAFSPDSGDDNASFTFFTDQPDRVRPVDFNIFDRWGNLVYHSGDGEYPNWNGSWKGLACYPGVYIWQLLIKSDEKERHFSGELLLIR